MSCSRLMTVSLTLLALVSSACSAGVLYVNRSASGAQDGTSWTDAWQTISDATTAAVDGDEIWVAAGTYRENVTLPDGVALYGGFAGTETVRTERSPAVHLTSIDAGKAGTGVTFASPAGSGTVLDGFRIRNGLPDEYGGGGASVDGGSPVITNNVFTENNAGQGAGIMVRNAAPLIANNLFERNNARDGAALNVYQNDPAVLSIVNNTFVNNTGEEGGFVIGMASQANVLFANNIVAFNDGQIYLDTVDSTATYLNNDAWQNSDNNYNGADPTNSEGNFSEDPVFQDREHGNYRLMPDSSAIDAGTTGAVIGATDLDNLARVQDSAVDMGAYENTGAAYHLVFLDQPGNGVKGNFLGVQPVLQVEDNTGQPVSGYSGPVTVSIDPGSGNPSGLLLGTTTVSAVDGVATFTDLRVDSGGDGYVLNAVTDDTLPAQSRMFTVTDYRLHVSKTGDDGNDGLSWATARLTVQSAVDSGPSEIWVAQGVYEENIKVSTALSLFGGFAGTESVISERDLTAHPTVLDGQHKGPVIETTGTPFDEIPTLQTLDGFTIRNGYNESGSGGGLSLPGFRGVIANCTITGNTAGVNGGGVYIEVTNSATPVTLLFSDNTIAGNIASSGGGLYIDVSTVNNAPIDISHDNEDISGNTAAVGGGAWLRGSQRLYGCRIDGNIAGLGGGIYQLDTLQAFSCEFTHNGVTSSSVDAMGGAVFSGDNAGFQSYTCTFSGNSVSAVQGKSANGGVWATTNNGSLYALDSRFQGNSAGQGGAVFARRAGNLNFYRCTLTANSASGDGGALSVSRGPISMECSLVAGNTAGGVGGGIALDSAPVAYNPYSDVHFLNNTFVANTAAAGGGGLDFRQNCTGTLMNNIVAFNSSGISQDASCFSSFFHNNVYGNGISADYVGVSNPTGTFGNISSEPVFVNRTTGDYHLGSGSPSVDSGDTGPFVYWSVDLEINPRVQGVGVDMGAFERAGTPGVFLSYDTNVVGSSAPGPLASQPVVRVIDANGVTLTDIPGPVTITLKPGFGTSTATLAGTTSVPVVNGIATFANLTIDKGGTDYYLAASIPGHGGADSVSFAMTTPVVRVSPTGNDRNDGSTWALAKRNVSIALEQSGANGSVWLKAGTYTGSVSIPRSNKVLGGFAGNETDESQRSPRTNETILDAGGNNSAVFVNGISTDTPVVDGLTLVNGAGYGGGVLVYNGSPTISNNIMKNAVTDFGGGILTFASGARILRNRFLNNVATYGGGGIYLAQVSDIVIDSNLFAGNSNPLQDGSAVMSWNSTFTCTNNTIVSNVGAGGAIGLWDSIPTIRNNIVVNNSSGIKSTSATGGSIDYNDVFGNTGFNYQTAVGGPNSLALDPLFANPSAGDYRLTALSPLREKGDDTVVSAGALDLDGAARIAGSHVDLGAYEYTVSGALGMADVKSALRIAAGGIASGPTDLLRLNVVTTGTSADRIDIRDAVLLAKKVAGLEPNP